jgi:hypothetical protein
MTDDRLEWYTQSLTILKIDYVTTDQDGTEGSDTLQLDLLSDDGAGRTCSKTSYSSDNIIQDKTTLQITPSMRIREEK